MAADDKEIRARYAGLVEEFRAGWEALSAEQMAGVFAEGGIFQPGPFEAPVEGRDAIREYWKTVPFEQAEIAFRYGEIFVVGPWFSTEFRCTFRRRRTGESVDVRGALFCETADGKISEMRMYWERRAKRP